MNSKFYSNSDSKYFFSILLSKFQTKLKLSTTYLNKYKKMKMSNNKNVKILIMIKRRIGLSYRLKMNDNNCFQFTISLHSFIKLKKYLFFHNFIEFNLLDYFSIKPKMDNVLIRYVQNIIIFILIGDKFQIIFFKYQDLFLNYSKSF